MVGCARTDCDRTSAQFGKMNLGAAGESAAFPGPNPNWRVLLCSGVMMISRSTDHERASNLNNYFSSKPLPDLCGIFKTNVRRVWQAIDAGFAWWNVS